MIEPIRDITTNDERKGIAMLNKCIDFLNGGEDYLKIARLNRLEREYFYGEAQRYLDTRKQLELYDTNCAMANTLRYRLLRIEGVFIDKVAKSDTL